MRLIKRISKVSALSLLIAVSSGVQADGTTIVSPTVMVTTSANVVNSITITSASGLSFGSFSPSSSAGKVVIDPAVGARSSSGGVTLIGNDGAASTVLVSGPAGATFSVNLPSTLALSSTSSGNTMTVDSFRTSLTGPNSTGTIGSTSTATFRIGATLSVNANQAAGAYAASFPLTLSYN